MRDRLFITGGSGFIGRQIVGQALASNFGVANFDLATPVEASQTPHWIRGDVRDLPALRAAVTTFQPQYFLHLASDIDISLTKMEQFTTTIEGTRNALTVAEETKLARFLHTSTQFVVKPGVEPQGEQYYDPYTLYGEAKAVAERSVWEANLRCPWTIVRPVIIWGPGHPSFAKQIFRHMASRRYLHPVGKPILRAFGYVENVASQMLRLGTAPANALARHVYYVGDATILYDAWADQFSQALTGKRARRIPTSFLRLLGWLGDRAKQVGLPVPIDSGRAFRMSTSSQIDLASTLEYTGEPKVDFSEGVSRTVAWLHELDSVRFGTRPR